MSATFKTECPACGQHIQAPTELREEGVRCPNCNTGFMPTAIAPAPVVPPSYGTLEQHLRHLRNVSAYPDLRQLIEAIHRLGLIVLGLAAVFQIAGGVNDSGIGSVFLGIGLLLILGLWWKLFVPVSSLVIDIADACVDLSRRQ